MGLPELVLPAGNLEKLKTAFLFGADAVYLGGKEFSLRAFAGNFAIDEIAIGLEFAHRRQKRVYVGVNILAHNEDLGKLPGYLEELARLQVDGLIVADPGILRLAQKYAAGIPITISTQANITNYESAILFQELGAKRIVLARELSLGEIKEIKNRLEIEIEVFIHGAMCVSYSGRCLLSHYMTGRSANKGACAHPCRYRYTLMEEKRPNEYYPIAEDERGTYILNSRDLCLIEYIPDLLRAGVDAFKVEGRMKSPLYVASVASVYRQAIDEYSKNRCFTKETLADWISELENTATRPLTSGFIAGEDPQIQDTGKITRQVRTDFCGVVTGYNENLQMVEIEQRANFGLGEDMELLIPGEGILKLDLEKMYDENFVAIQRARHPQQKVFIPFCAAIPPYSVLRRRVTNK